MPADKGGVGEKSYLCRVMGHNFRFAFAPCRILLLQVVAASAIIWLTACSTARFIPEDKKMLASVKLKSDSRRLSLGEYRLLVRQEPNARWFQLLKVPLGIYCLQGNDSTKRFNRFIRRIGEAPVIYDESLTDYSIQAIDAALKNKGYLHSRVTIDTLQRGHKVHLTYNIHPGMRYYVGNIRYEYDNDTVRLLVEADSSNSQLYKGMPLDASALNAERTRIVNLLRDKGYYNFHKEFVSFVADTAVADYGVDLTLRMARPHNVDSARAYRTYRLRDVNIYEETVPGEPSDTTSYKGVNIYYNDRIKIFRRVYSNHNYIRPDSLYRATDLRDTYSSINSLSPISYSTIRYREAGEDSTLLDCDINVQLSKPNNISAEVEGTNTSGDLGAAVVLTFANRNTFRGAESLSLKLRGAYEAIKGLEGYNNQNYIEYSAELGLRFPTLMVPFVSSQKKQAIKGTSEVSVMYDSQNRPEFHRRVLTAAWTYRWAPTSAPGWQHRLDLLSMNYVFMPWISDTFREEYLNSDDPLYAVLRYTYEDLFIVKTGYSFTYNSLKTVTGNGLYHTNGFQIRFNVETAGNVLYGLSSLFKAQRATDGQYSLFDIAYSQYAKIDFDYAKSFVIDDRNSIALHAAVGVGIPYGNSTILPYEKRYFAGGANSVRGWGVRELGPGSYVGNDGNIDYINQTGNVKLDLSVEYRSHLFWKIHGAAFIDAGNIWNTRNYTDQEGGLFKFNRFYKQIAVAYGLGLRLNLDYFIIRLDGGMKAINPAVESGSGHYPILHPNFSRDFAFHFAVGLPF